MIVLFSTVAIAEHHEENLTTAKQHMSANIDQKISLLQDMKSCINSAKTRDALKKCRESHRAELKNLRKENESKKEEIKSKIRDKKKSKK